MADGTNDAQDPRAAGPQQPGQPAAPGYGQTPQQPSPGYGYPPAPPSAPAPGAPAGAPGYGYPPSPQTPPPGQNPYAGSNPYGPAPGQPQPGQVPPQPGQVPPPPPAHTPQPGQVPPQATPMPQQQPGNPYAAYGPNGPQPPNAWAPGPSAPGNPPGGNRNGKIIGGIVGGVVALALIIGGAVFFLGGSGGGGGGSKKQAHGTTQTDASGTDISANYKALFRVPSLSQGSGNLDEAIVGTMVGKNFVLRADKKGAIAYALKSSNPKGQQLFTVKPPQAGMIPCAVSPTTNSANQGAILFQIPKGSCSNLVVFDGNKSGAQIQAGSTAPGSTSDDIGSGSATVSISDTHVVAVRSGGAVAVNIKTGAKDWTYSGGSQYCNTYGSAQGDTVVTWSSCSGASDDNFHVRLFDLTSSKPNHMLWEYTVPGGFKSNLRLISISPVTLLITKDFDDKGQFTTFDSHGNPYPTIKAADGNGAGPINGIYGPANNTDNQQLFFNGTTMYTVVSPDKSDNTNNFVVAYDLTTGKPKWQSDPRKSNQAKVFGQDGKGLLAIDTTDYNVPPKLVRFSFNGGTMTSGGSLPGDDEIAHDLQTCGNVRMIGDTIYAFPDYNAYNSRLAVYAPK
ncbi:hypothetical protein BIV57_03325 [Mangrovactinospora gilvigrisea]|uniref:Uncharacterized protein n=1 Tax=Mangrovactinospora gilvigrisea TaxID=1428644 RepID=A0A1J7BJP9_9ACTN|nr:hypothetical protein [Mangrovactinospora gilvigrisea]OIV38911.1 hypothetical protein BIV57_03325 [Mangrovactinospora gilvigrisea]